MQQERKSLARVVFLKMQELPPKTSCCSARELKTRAVALAEAGVHDSWEAVAGAVERNNCPGAIARITGDMALRRLLTEICEAQLG